MKIPFNKPEILGNEIKYIRDAYKNGKMIDKWFFYDKSGNLKEIRYFSPDF